eukprot:Pgem_evm1s8190
MGIVQDTLTGIRKFTLRDCFVDYENTMNLLLSVPSWNGKIPAPCILKPKPLWSGKQLYSLIISDNINYENSDKCPGEESKDKELLERSPSDTRILIVNGELLMGCITKAVVGTAAGSLIHVTFKENGPDVCRLLFDYTQKLVNNWIMLGGHSMSISDIVTDDDLVQLIGENLEASKVKVRQIIEDATAEKLLPTPGNNIRQ